MINTYLKLILLIVFIAISLTCLAQEAGFLTPEKINPYTFDPTAVTKSEVSNYPDLGYEAYNKADYETAARYYLAYLQTKPDDAGSWYNLSCCYGLLDRADLAAKYLKVSYKAGFTDLEHIQRDTDFDKIKAAPDFTLAVDSLKAWSVKKANYLGQMEYFPTQHYLPFWIHLPTSFNPKNKYTLLIGLHGYGDKAYNFSYLWRHIENEEVIFVVPEAPYPFVSGNDAAFSWSPFVPMESKTGERAYDMLNEYITDLTEYIQSKYKIEQTWLLGFSQGAYNGYMLAFKNPKVFDGLIACGGGIVTEVITDKDLRASNKMKVIISHGNQDKVVAFEEATKAKAILEKAGFQNLRFDEFEGGHTVSPTAFKPFIKWIVDSRIHY